MRKARIFEQARITHIAENRRKPISPSRRDEHYGVMSPIRTRVYICRWPVRLRKFFRRRIF